MSSSSRSPLPVTGGPLTDISREHPDTTFLVWECEVSESRWYLTLKVTGPSARNVVRSLEEHVTVRTSSMERDENAGILVRAIVDRSSLEGQSSEVDEPLTAGFAVRDGEVVEQEFPDDPGCPSGEEAVSDTPIDGRSALTDRQRQVLRIALELGYYDYPRECTLTELAAELDIAKSTCSGILQRVESSVMHDHADEVEAIDSPDS